MTRGSLTAGDTGRSAVLARPQSLAARVARRIRKEAIWYAFVAPNIVTFLVFTLFSWGFLVYLSFHSWSLVGAREYAGIANYQQMLGDRILHRAITNTISYALMFVLPGAALSLGLAILVNQGLRGMHLFRAIYYLPVVTSIAVIALIWKFILLPNEQGILNYILGFIGVGPYEWLLNRTLAMPAITAMSIWSSAGYYMVLWLAGLQAVPEEYYEAARMDGAGKWQTFRHVTLPLLKPTAIFIIMISMIGAFQVFGPQYMLTGGGPFYATTTMVFYIWQQAFNFYRMGYAATISILLFVMILIVSLIQRHYLGWSESIL
ncbi:MAG: carbohydrate ABC transporter permease [Anaerolineae bacterium]|jgi:ABC-type sugar transport system permease subunit